MTYSLSGLSTGYSSAPIEPELTPRVTAYTQNITDSTIPILHIEAMPATEGASVTMTDGTNSFHNGMTQIPPEANAYTWRYPYLPSTGGTVVIAIALTVDGVTKDYTLTINFTKTST